MEIRLIGKYKKKTLFYKKINDILMIDFFFNRCDICHKVLVRKRDLERHIRSRHTASNSPPVVIPISLHEGIALDCRTSN